MLFFNNVRTVSRAEIRFQIYNKFNNIYLKNNLIVVFSCIFVSGASFGGVLGGKTSP